MEHNERLADVVQSLQTQLARSRDIAAQRSTAVEQFIIMCRSFGEKTELTSNAKLV